MLQSSSGIVNCKGNSAWASSGKRVLSTANAWSKFESLLLWAKPRRDLQLAVPSIDAIGEQSRQLFNLPTKEVKKLDWG